jgi:hypothetical protein
MKIVPTRGVRGSKYVSQIQWTDGSDIGDEEVEGEVEQDRQRTGLVKQCARRRISAAVSAPPSHADAVGIS